MWYLKNHVFFSAFQNLTLFHNFLQITSKYSQKHHIEKSEKSFTRKKSEKLQKGPKKGQKWPFFDPGGPNFDPFFTICLQITSKYAQKHHIKKIRKIHSLEQIHKSAKLKKCPKKKLKKMAVFGPGGPPNFDSFLNIFCKSLQITSK